MSVNSDKEALGGHRKRLRARLECEPQAVTDYEVMELVLGLAIARKDTRNLAHRLIDHFGNFRSAIDAKPNELEQIDGFGPGLLSLWRLLREILARHALAPLLAREVLASPENVALAARSRLGSLAHEESWLALVDAQNRLISWERLRRGGISSIAIQPRDVLEAALVRKASGIVLVHNHPGGSAAPSRADLDLTAEIQNLAPRLGLRLLDHVIVTSDDCYSIAAGKHISGRQR